MEMAVVIGLLGFTVFLFVSEIIRIDLAALLVLVLVGILSYVPGLQNLADVTHLFDGFASNAVISIIAVMIVGAGLDRTGIMNKVAAAILKHGGTTEARVLPIVSGTVGVISQLSAKCRCRRAFPSGGQQNLGARWHSAEPVADADGVLCHPWRDDDHGGIVAADPAERPHPDSQSGSARGNEDGAVPSVLGHAHRRCTDRHRYPLLSFCWVAGSCRGPAIRSMSLRATGRRSIWSGFTGCMLRCSRSMFLQTARSSAKSSRTLTTRTTSTSSRRFTEARPR